MKLEGFTSQDGIDLVLGQPRPTGTRVIAFAMLATSAGLLLTVLTTFL